MSGYISNIFLSDDLFGQHKNDIDKYISHDNIVIGTINIFHQMKESFIKAYHSPHILFSKLINDKDFWSYLKRNYKQYLQYDYLMFANILIQTGNDPHNFIYVKTNDNIVINLLDNFCKYFNEKTNTFKKKTIIKLLLDYYLHNNPDRFINIFNIIVNNNYDKKIIHAFRKHFYDSYDIDANEMFNMHIGMLNVSNKTIYELFKHQNINQNELAKFIKER